MSLPKEADLKNVKLYCGKKYDLFYYDKSTKREITKEGRSGLKFYKLYKNEVYFERADGVVLNYEYGINKDSTEKYYILVRQSKAEENEKNAEDPSVNSSSNSSAIGAGAGASGGARKQTRKMKRKATKTRRLRK